VFFEFFDGTLLNGFPEAISPGKQLLRKLLRLP
jgi:hypothetical protein